MRSEEQLLPTYYRLERYLREQILAGALRPGDPVPTEAQLAQQFNTSRVTVRQALGRLAFDGLIERQRGRRTVVAEPRLEHRKPFLSFEEEMEARGAKPTLRLLEIRTVPAEGVVAKRLEIPSGTPVICLKRQRFVDDQLVGYEIRYLPKRIGDALTADEINNRALVPAVRRILGKSRTRLILDVTASIARAEEADMLEVKPGAPVLVRENTWYADPEGPVQYGKSVYRGDRYRMVVEFSSAHATMSS